MDSFNPHDAKAASPVPQFQIVGRLEDLAFGGGSEMDDGYGQWNPHSGGACCFPIPQLDGTVRHSHHSMA